MKTLNFNARVDKQAGDLHPLTYCASPVGQVEPTMVYTRVPFGDQVAPLLDINPFKKNDMLWMSPVLLELSPAS